jgi:hypothetical protein
LDQFLTEEMNMTIGEKYAELMTIGEGAYAAIAEMVAALECENEDEEARERIEEDALSVEIRSGWQPLGETLEPAEFCITLTTGGPAVRIIGELSDGEPSRARLEVQDWFTPWTEYRAADSDVLLAYCQCFYFGQ